MKRSAGIAVAHLSLALLAQVAVLAPASAAPGDPRVHLSWGAPYGMPGARETIAPTCPDSTRRDTLYLSFEFTRPETVFVGAGGELQIYAQPGDTLGSFWDMGRGGANYGGMIGFFQRDDAMPGESPWGGSATGMIKFDRTRTDARIWFGEVMAMNNGTPVEPNRPYTLGRIVFCARRPGLTGCDRPVCIEWRKGEFVVGTGRSLLPAYRDVVASRGSELASCRGRVPVWRPPGFGSPARHATPDSSSRIHH